MTATATPLVTVVIIFLDAERFLAEAVDSVLAQTYSAWELLLVDDGSSDGSTALAREYAARDPARVRYLDHPRHANRGMSASRNLGLRHARGDYIAFLDADDVWLPRTLEQQVAVLDAHPEVAMVYGRLRWWYSWSERAEDQTRDFVEELGVLADTVVQPPTLVPLILQDRAAVPSGMLIRRRVAERVGGFETAFRGEYEDQVFCAKVCLEEPVFASSHCWYAYRQHAASCVAVGLASGESNAARLRFLQWLQSYLTDRGCSDRAVWRALERELWPYHHPALAAAMRCGRVLLWHAEGRMRGAAAAILRRESPAAR